VGSVLVGSVEFIDQARKWRKMVGGGMRQAGVLAAAGLVALDTMVDRLAEDHQNARRLAHGLANIEGLHIDPERIQTNIVFFEVDENLGTAADMIAALEQQEVKVSYPGKQSIRMVTHRHISGEDIEEALSRVSTAVRGMS
jgi:threonine aldolase